MKSNKKNNLIIVLTIILFAFILYGNTIQNNYSIDDDFVTNANPLIQKGVKGIGDIFTSRYMQKKQGQIFGYRPVTKSFYAVEYQLFGLNPHISHLINILIYALTGVFLFFLLKKLLKNYNTLFPFAVTLLFLAHPIHTEVVCSLKNREEMLSFLFSLIALYLFVKYTENQKITNILLGLLSFIIAYLSKKNAFTFAIIIPLVIYFFTNASLKKTIIIFALLATTVIIVIFVPRLYLLPNDSQIFFWQNPLIDEKNILNRISTGLYVLLFYLRLLIFPHPLRFYYGYDMLPVTNWSNVWVIISFVFYLSIFIYAIINFKKKHILSFTILYYLLTISVFSNILVLVTGIVGERLVYFSSLGFCIILAYLLFKIFKIDGQKKYIPVKSQYKLICVLLIILIPYTIKTICRNRNWKDGITLYSHDIKYLKNSAKANDLLASELFTEITHKTSSSWQTKDRHKINLMIKYYNRAVKICPEYSYSWNKLGSVYYMILGQYDVAIPYFEKAVKVNPKFAKAYFNLGYCYEKLTDYDKTITYYKQAIKLDAKYINPVSRLANLYNRLGYFEVAVDLNKKIMKINPDSDIPYINMGNYYLASYDTLTAIKYIEKAVKVNPHNYDIIKELANYFYTKKDFVKAEYYFKKLKH